MCYMAWPKKKEKWIIKSDHGSFLLQFLAFRIKAYLVAWLRPFTSTCHSPHQCWTPFTQTTGSGCGCRIQNWETSRQILPLPLSGCDLGQVIFLLWNKFSHLKNENWEKKKKNLVIDNSASLIQVLWWLNGNYIGNALSTKPGTEIA